jgi:hypothetical protein
MEKRTVLGALGRGSLAAALSVSLVLGPAAPVFAQSEMERAGAREAAKEGAKAFGEKRWAASLDLFTRAESLVHAPPHLLYIARSAASLGQLVKARETYLKITREKLAATAPPAFKDAQASATKELAALEPRVPFVKVVVDPAGAKGLKLLMDDKEIPTALIGVSMPADPGDHRFKATADGAASDEIKATLKEAGKDSVTLTLKPAAAAAVAPLPPPPAPAASAAPPPAAPAAAPPAQPAASTTVPAEPDKGGSGLRNVGLITGGVGLLGIGLGVAFMAKAGSKDSEASDVFKCDPYCSPEQKQQVKDLESQRDSAKTLGVTAIVIGGAALGTGLVLYLVAGGSEKKAASVSPFVGVGSVGLSGRF